jgi:hypothetical protein
MARAFQFIDSKVHIFSDRQKILVNKTSGCSDHRMILNELLHNTNRKKEGLVVTAIDFRNTCGSVPPKLMVSAKRQRNSKEELKSELSKVVRCSNLKKDMATAGTSTNTNTNSSSRTREREIEIKRSRNPA